MKKYFSNSSINSTAWSFEVVFVQVGTLTITICYNYIYLLPFVFFYHLSLLYRSIIVWRPIFKMASSAKQARTSKFYSLDKVLSILDEENDEEEVNSESGGISSSEESDLDLQLLDSDDSRW